MTSGTRLGAEAQAHRKVRHRQTFSLILRDGAPRPMKMGTIVSPWRYDAAAAQAIRPDNLRGTSILRYAARPAFSRFCGWSGYPSIAAISIYQGTGAMGHNRTYDSPSRRSFSFRGSATKI